MNNNAIDWKKKLTSRKFWAAVCTLVTNVIIAFGGSEDQTVKITALIMAGATVIAYIIGEGLVDAANSGTNIYLASAEDIDYQPPEDEDEEEETTEEEAPGING